MNQLTFRSKQIVIVGAIGVVLLGVTLVLLVMTDAGNGGQEQQPAFIIFSVIGLAVIGTLLLIYSRMRWAKYASSLAVEYYEVHEDLGAALQNSSLSLVERKEIQLDILGLLVQAQQDGRPARDVVGSDLSEFVANIESSYGYRGRFGFYLLHGFQYFIFLLCVSQAAVFGIRGITPFMETLIGVPQIPFSILLSFVLIPMMTFAMSKRKVLLMVLVPIGFALLYLAVNRALRGSFNDASWAQFYLDGEVGFITSWEVLVLWMILFAAASVGKWLLRRFALMTVQGS